MRHLHIVEQTLTLPGGTLEHMPRAVIEKALIQLRFINSGSRKRRGLLRLQSALEGFVFRGEVALYLDGPREAIRCVSGASGEEDTRQVCEGPQGKFVDTQIEDMQIEIPLPQSLAAFHLEGEVLRG